MDCIILVDFTHIEIAQKVGRGALWFSHGADEAPEDRWICGMEIMWVGKRRGKEADER